MLTLGPVFFAIFLCFGELEGLLLYIMVYGHNVGRGVWMCKKLCLNV